jgi:hypothetical protein
MINSADRRRIGQARLLRRQGKTYEEIRGVIGSVSEDDLRRWMKGIPRPPGTFRAKAKDELRQKCRQLRRAGLTYNSDPSVIVVFVRWLALIGIGLDRCRFRVAIHESADVPGAERYWADLVGFDVATIYRSTIKRHQPKTVRYNTGESYRGCLVVDVAMSAELYRHVEGWWRGVASGAERVQNPTETLG